MHRNKIWLTFLALITFAVIWFAWGAANKLKTWYDPSSPIHSTIVKTFPMKELVSTAVLLGLWLYFIWLGFYVTRFYR